MHRGSLGKTRFTDGGSERALCHSAAKGGISLAAHLLGLGGTGIKAHSEELAGGFLEKHLS